MIALALALACGGSERSPDADPGETDTHDTHDSAPPTSPPLEPVNVVVVMLDDFGRELLDGEGVEPATPMIDGLAATGVTFERAWGAPACSQARAAFLSGQYTVRFGLGDVLGLRSGWTFPDEVELLPEQLAAAGLASLAVGKWHLGHTEVAGEPLPVAPGFTDYALNLGTLGEEFSVSGQPMSYYAWEEFTPTASTYRTDAYNTSAVVDHALARIPAMPEPWFTYLAFNAPHRPLHQPPPELRRTPAAGPEPTDDELFRWMTEAVDVELERFADSLDPAVRARTVFVVTADNGTSDADIDPLLADRAKGTVYETGVGVPLIVAGPGIVDPGRVSSANVNLVDLRPTIAELMGAPASAGPVDGVSLVPILRGEAEVVRQFDFVTKFEDTPCTWMRAIRDERYKAIDVGSEMYGLYPELYDLVADPGESDDLLLHPSLTAEEQARLADLASAQAEILATSSIPPCG